MNSLFQMNIPQNKVHIPGLFKKEDDLVMNEINLRGAHTYQSTFRGQNYRTLVVDPDQVHQYRQSKRLD